MILIDILQLPFSEPYVVTARDRSIGHLVADRDKSFKHVERVTGPRLASSEIDHALGRNPGEGHPFTPLDQILIVFASVSGAKNPQQFSCCESNRVTKWPCWCRISPMTFWNASLPLIFLCEGVKNPRHARFF